MSAQMGVAKSRYTVEAHLGVSYGVAWLFVDQGRRPIASGGSAGKVRHSYGPRGGDVGAVSCSDGVAV